MTDSFDFQAQKDGSEQPLIIEPGSGMDIIRGGKGDDVGDDGHVSPRDALIVINTLDGEDDLFLSGREADRDGEFAPLSDDGAADEPDHIDPVLLVVSNQDLWSHE